jgi:NAD(P)-dependent dehydrogenase (short-subunit alcohol dehydrogenase family)
MTVPSDRSQTDVPIAVVSDACSGLGRATVAALIDDGWVVAMLGNDREQLHNMASDGAYDSSRAYEVCCNLTDALEVEQAFAEIARRFGRIDLLFNNSSTNSPAGFFTEWSAEEWHAVVDTNLNSMFYCLQSAFRIMCSQRPRGGRIINHGSSWPVSMPVNSIAYTSTKYAVTGLTRAAALAGPAFDITVEQIDMGHSYCKVVVPRPYGESDSEGRGHASQTDDQIMARSVCRIVRRPPEPDVSFHTVMPEKSPVRNSFYAS